MEFFFPLIIFSVIAAIILQNIQRSRRKKFILAYQFPNTVTEKLLSTYPHLSASQAEWVISGLRDYFTVCSMAKRRMISMPSQAVDVVWHEFILFTRDYQKFCQQAFGNFLHHTPAEAMQSPTKAQDGIKRAWRLACKNENINPQSPTRLPRLFAMDTELEIPDGFRYTLNCLQSVNNNDGSVSIAFCGSHIGCGGGCGGSGCGGDGGGGCGGD